MRAFIVGNGPSLKETPLELIEDEISYGANAVHLIYNETDWRPKHVVIGDLTAPHSAWVNEIVNKKKPWVADERLDRFLTIIERNSNPHLAFKQRIHVRGGYEKWALKLLGPRDNVSYFDVCTHHNLGVGEELDERAPVEWHLPQVCRWGGAVLMAVQLAALEGYTPLYLLGCDMGYVEGGENHFVSDYDEPIGLAKAKALNLIIGNAHDLASVSWDIYNASIAGVLESYPRVNLEELF